MPWLTCAAGDLPTRRASLAVAAGLAGVPLWVPELGGPIDPDNEAHDLIMSVFGGMSKGERNRIRVRVRAAMAAQAKMEGRYLGGRPPYGYELADLGSHPNPAKAADGRRLHGLTPCSATAPVVVRIFAEYLDGKGLFAIAEGLTRDGIPCPSAQDPARNRHRSSIAWSKGAIRAILTNPRYTGRQVWNRQRKHEVLLDVEDVALGHTTKMRWNVEQEWITSEQLAHTAIIDEDTFDRAQQLLASRRRTPGRLPRTRKRVRHPYVLRGGLICGICQRKMQGQHSHGTAYYRCRFPTEYALANNVNHPRNVCLREDDLLPSLDDWLTRAFAPDQLCQTITTMVEAQHTGTAKHAIIEARQRLAEADRKLALHRAALEAGADPAVVTEWITETQAERADAKAALQQAASNARSHITSDEIHELIAGLGDLTRAINDADAADKAEVSRQLGLQLTYHPHELKVRAEISLDSHSRWVIGRVRGGT